MMAELMEKETRDFDWSSWLNLGRKPVDFEGRLPQGAFWRDLSVSFVLTGGFVGLASVALTPAILEGAETLAFGALIYVMLPRIARRMQDTGRSGRLLFQINKLIPVSLAALALSAMLAVLGLDSAAALALALCKLLLAPAGFCVTGGAIFGFFVSDPHPNQYGPNPTEVTP